MTAPLIPQSPPKDRTYWTKVLHNAAQVPVEHPRYSEARQVIQLALENMATQAREASAADPENAPPNKWLGRTVAFGQGASLGAASTPEFRMALANASPATAGLMQLLGSTPAEHQDFLGQARANDPIGTGVADLAGMAATGGLAAPVAAPVLTGLSPTAGTALMGAGLMGTRGAIEPIQGMSRGMSALVMGTTAGIGGALVGKLVGKLLPIATRVARNVGGLFGRGAARAASKEVQGLSEAAVRSELQRLNVRPELIERTVEAWRTGKVPTRPIPAPTVPQEPIATRPGETLIPVGPKQMAVEGPLPPARTSPYPPSLVEMQGFNVNPSPPSSLAGLSTGQTLPYYARGGQAAEAILPGRTGGTAAQATTQRGIQLQQLQYLARLPEAEFEQAAQSALFPQHIMEMLRAVRAQMATP